MNSRSSAAMCSGSHTSEGRPPAAGSSPLISSCHQWSRPAVICGASTVPASLIRRATTTWSTQRDAATAASTFALSAAAAPRRHPPSAVTHHLGLGVDDPVGQRVRREAPEHHRVHRPDAGAGQHGHRQLGDHRHVDGHPVAPADAEPAQHVGEPGHLHQQLAVGDGPGVARLTLPVEGHRVPAAGGHVTVEAVVRHVQGAPVEPPGEGQVPLEHGVPGPEPVEGSGLLGPEPGPVGGGPVVDARIPDHRLAPERLGGREHPLLGEVVLDGGCRGPRQGPSALPPPAVCSGITPPVPCRRIRDDAPGRRASAYRRPASTMEGP